MKHLILLLLLPLLKTEVIPNEKIVVDNTGRAGRYCVFLALDIQSIKDKAGMPRPASYRCLLPKQ